MDELDRCENSEVKEINADADVIVSFTVWPSEFDQILSLESIREPLEPFKVNFKHFFIE